MEQVLVAYGTKYGATAEIAEQIGQVLVQEGLGVEVLPADRAGELAPYQAVVLGSAVYIGQCGQMILNIGPHDNDGPQDRFGMGTVEMGEFRNIYVYHEGTTARDTMCHRVELYEDTDGWSNQNRSLMLDFQDRNLDDWDDLREENFNDKASLLRTYLTPGQLLDLYEDVNYGEEFKQMVGQAYGMDWADLGVWAFEGWNDRISSVKRYPFEDPGGPYSGSEGSSIPLDTAN